MGNRGKTKIKLENGVRYVDTISLKNFTADRNWIGNTHFLDFRVNGEYLIHRRFADDLLIKRKKHRTIGSYVKRYGRSLAFVELKINVEKPKVNRKVVSN